MHEQQCLPSTQRGIRLVSSRHIAVPKFLLVSLQLLETLVPYLAFGFLVSKVATGLFLARLVCPSLVRSCRRCGLFGWRFVRLASLLWWKTSCVFVVRGRCKAIFLVVKHTCSRQCFTFLSGRRCRECALRARRSKV